MELHAKRLCRQRGAADGLCRYRNEGARTRRRKMGRRCLCEEDRYGLERVNAPNLHFRGSEDWRAILGPT
jgi:hypothetical protein